MSKLWIENGTNGGYGLAYQDTQPNASCEDKTNDIPSWHINWERIKKDYKFCRDEIKRITEELAVSSVIDTITDPTTVTPSNGDDYLVDTGGIGDFLDKDGLVAIYNGSSWDFQSKSERGFDLSDVPTKVILCEHKIGSQAQRDSIVGINNAVLLGLQYADRVSQARKVRTGYASTLLWNYLPDQAQTIVNEAVVANFYVSYAIHGQEGVARGDNEGIIDWIDGTTGTSWDGNGIRDRAYTPIEGLALSDLCDRAKDILLNGDLDRVIV